MPRIARELSGIEVRRLEKVGLNPVGGVSGLHLQITKTGARSWILRVTQEGRRRDFGLGSFPDVTLAQARERAREIKDKVWRGIDPLAERKANREALKAADVKAITFSKCAEQFLKRKESEFRNPKHIKQWRSTLEQYAGPVIGDLPVENIELAHILQVLEPIWWTKTETASRVRGRIESVLAFAIASGYRDGANVASWKGNLDAILPQPGKLKNVTHHKALPWSEIGAFVEKLRERKGTAARALEFLILTAGRSGEVRGARWEEIDLKSKTWTVPAERMKTQKEHVVPLSDDAIALLESLPRMNEFVFPGPRGGPLSDVSLSKPLKNMNATPHGFRSTFRDWCAESTGYPNEVCEMALAHTISSAVERAYRRGDLLAKRARLMRDWAKYCRTVQVKGEVIAMREKA